MSRTPSSLWGAGVAVLVMATSACNKATDPSKPAEPSPSGSDVAPAAAPAGPKRCGLGSTRDANGDCIPNATPALKAGEVNTGGATPEQHAALAASWKPAPFPELNTLEPMPGVDVMPQDVADQLTISPNALRFPGSMTEVANWPQGKIITAPPKSPGAPGNVLFGFARKVERVEVNGDTFIVHTSTPDLSELVHGELKVHLDPEKARTISWDEIPDKEWAAANLYTELTTLEGFEPPGHNLRFDYEAPSAELLPDTGDPFFSLVKKAAKSMVNTVVEVVEKITPSHFSASGDFHLNKKQAFERNIFDFELEKTLGASSKFPVKVSLEGKGDLYGDITFNTQVGFSLVAPNPVHRSAPPMKVALDVDALLSATLGFKVELEAAIESDGGDDEAVEGFSEKKQKRVEKNKEKIEAFAEHVMGDPEAAVPGGWRKPLFVSTPLMQTVWAGPVPIVFTQTFQVDMECGFEARAELKADASVTLTSTLQFAAAYEKGRNATLSPPKVGFEKSHKVEVTGGGEITVSCGLIPRINAFIYDSVGINAGVRVSGVAKASYESSCEENANSTQPKGEVELDMGIGLGFQVGGRVQVPGSSYAGVAGTKAGIDIGPFDLFPQYFSIFKREWDLPGLGYCAPTCQNGTMDNTETDRDCGGECATQCSQGEGCATNSDCQPNLYCSNKVCGTDHCSDGVKSGHETGVDCGGACKPCANEVTCKVDADCQSKQCSLVTRKLRFGPASVRISQHLCVADACTDGAKADSECGIDCGGSCSAKCKTGTLCGKSEDCESGVSNGITCVSSACQNFKLDENETGLDCGGACSPCRNGLTCKADSDCQSQSCQNGTCSPALACTPNLPGRVVISALWGKHDKWVEVGDYVQAAINRGDATLYAGNATFDGQDPIYGTHKDLKVTWWVNGEEQTVTASERTELSLVAKAPPAPVYTVLNARWFAQDKSADVTARLNQLAKRGQYRFDLRNHVMETDPAKGVQKTLEIEYLNGQCQRVKSSHTEGTTFAF